MPDITLMGATYPDVPAVTLPSGATTATFYDLESLDLVTSVNGETGDVTVQPTLVSGTNIKTVNNQSILGSGDLAIQEGTEMVVLKYGKSTWADFIAAYPNAVVYCRASSNSNPASGAQTRLAFMAYVNNETAPTNVEFQYYRSVSSHSATQQGDQVYVYKLDKTAGWTVTVREAYTRITAGTGMTQSYSGGVLTLQAPRELPTVTASDNGKVLGVVNGAWAATDGGGGGGMLVTFTEANYTYTADKTFGEIAAALDAGIMPSVKFVPATSSNHPAYAGISYFNIQNASHYAMKFTSFYTSSISGSPSSYPSWSSDN